jgi:uncharacterized membrane protein
MESLIFPVKLITTLGCALMAGLFFVFSNTIMRALAQRPANEGIAAMQAINIAIVNPLFLLVFLGTAVGCVLVIIFSLLRWGNPVQATRLLVRCFTSSAASSSPPFSTSPETTPWPP